MSPDSGENPPSRGAHADRPLRSLHICCECGSRLVYPRSIEERGEDSWWLELHCPECHWTAADVFRRETVEEFEEELDRGQAQIEADLSQLVQANMADYVERFTTALAADAIQPIDF